MVARRPRVCAPTDRFGRLLRHGPRDPLSLGWFVHEPTATVSSTLSVPSRELTPLTAPPPERPELPDGAQLTPVVPAWRPSGVLLAFALGLGGTIAAAAVIGGIAIALGADRDSLPPGVNVLLTIAQDIAFVGAAILVVSRVARPTAWQFGLRGARPKAFVGWLLVAFLAFILLSAAYSALVDIGPQEDLPDELGADGSTLALFAAAFLVTVIAPFAEELFFRGFIFTSLRRWGLWPAALVAGTIFGAIHLGSAPDVLYLPILGIFGVVLCLLYWKTGSLYPAIALHAINNCIAFAGTRDGWTWEYAVLLAASLGSIALVGLLVRRVSGPAPHVLTS